MSDIRTKQDTSTVYISQVGFNQNETSPTVLLMGICQYISIGDMSTTCAIFVLLQYRYLITIDSMRPDLLGVNLHVGLREVVVCK